MSLSLSILTADWSRNGNVKENIGVDYITKEEKGEARTKGRHTKRRGGGEEAR